MIRFAITIFLCVTSFGPAVAGTVNNPSVTEGSSAVVTYNLGYTAPSGGVEVQVATQGISATLGVDYSISNSVLGYNTVPAGNNALSITATIFSDGTTENNETFMVGFMENLASNPGFDLSAPNWSGSSINTQQNIENGGSSNNNILHIKEKETPSRNFTLQSGEQYTIEFNWSEATADGTGTACNDSLHYPALNPGHVNFADTLTLEVIDRANTANVVAFTIYNEMGSGGVAEFPGDALFNLSSSSASEQFTWSGGTSVMVQLSATDANGGNYDGTCGFVVDNFRINKQVVLSTVTISDAVANTPPSVNTNQALVDEVIIDTQTVIAKHLSTQGKSLLTASQNLVQTSIDHLLVRTQLQAKRNDGDSANTAFRQRSPAETPQTSPSVTLDEQKTFAHRFRDAVKLLNVDIDDFGYRGALDFDLYEPLSGQNKAFISKFKASISDQDNGPETTNMMASYALETESDNGETIFSRFLHLTKTKADFRYDHSGTQDSQGISAGIYKVYSPGAKQLLTIFGSLGVSHTDLALTTTSSNVNHSYKSVNAQAGVTSSWTFNRRGMFLVWEMATHALYSRQQSRYANVLIGSTDYLAKVNGRNVKDITVTLTPKFIFDIKDSEGQIPSNFQLSPSVRCGNGTGGASCGYGVSTSFNRMSADGDGHVTLGMSLDRYRKTDTTSIFIDIERSFLGHKSIRFDTHLEQNFLTSDTSGRPDYQITSVVRLPL